MIDLTKLKGKFLTFEGSEGTGKTTLSKRLTKEFQKQNIDVVKTFDPGGCESAQKIRKLLLSNKNNFCKDAEMLLFSAARTQLSNDVIIPALKKGSTVITDRWFDSTIIYQGMCRGYDLNILNLIYNHTCGYIPHMTFIFDVDPVIGLKRSYKTLNKSGADESKFEDLGLEIHKKIRTDFLKLAKSSPRYHIIDASQNLDDCYLELLKTIENYLL